MTGSIKTLTDRGFGFIAADGMEKEIFFHSSAVVGTSIDQLAVGDKVSFDTEDSPKGPRAVNVQKA
jgi:CspA family cold shock protein